MDPDNRLDGLLARLPRGGDEPATDAATVDRTARDLAPLLDAAARVAEYRTLAPAPSFARRLEADLLTQSARQREQQARADISEEAAPPLTAVSGDPRVPADLGSGVGQEMAVPRRAGPRPRPLRRSWRLPWPGTRLPRPVRRVRWVVWPAAAAAAVLVFLAGVGALAASASPGSSLYGLQRWEHTVQVGLAGTAADRARLQLQYAWEALRAVDSVVAQHGGVPAYEEALSAFDEQAHSADSAVAQVPTGPDQVDLSSQWQTFRAHARADLHAALATLAWPQRLRTSTTLADLGESIPRVTQVSIERSIADGGQTWECLVTGSGFLPGARLLVDGQALGVTMAVSSTQLVASVAAYAAEPAPTTVGVGNPDGTAAATTHVSISSESDGDHGGDGTPTTGQSTPGSDGGGGSTSGGSSGSGSGDGGGSGSGDQTPTPTVLPTPTTTPGGGSGDGSGSGGH